jgi:hypothetical protein
VPGTVHPRVLAGAALLVGLLAYYVGFRSLPNLPTAVDVLFVGFVLIPAVFGLVWLALPVRRWRGLAGAAVAFAVLAVVASEAGLDVLANFAKLGAATAAAFWFLGFFENALWVALVALLIPFVDAYSVWRGPTKHIISERPEVFTALSFAFPLPGERQVLLLWREPLAGGPARYDVIRIPGGKRNDEPLRDKDGDGEVGWLEAELDADRDYRYLIMARHDAAGAATSIDARADDVNEGVEVSGVTSNRTAPTDVRVESVDSSAKLGLPDLLFFALFLAAADAFALRTRLTWLLMTASFGITLALTYYLWVDGLPALPLLAVGFLLANADLLWRRFRERKGDGRTTEGPARPPAGSRQGNAPSP